MATTPPRSGVAERPGDVAVQEDDAVLVGASVHVGKHQPEVLAFVERNRDRLATMPTVFFQVALSPADENGRERAAGYVDSFVERTGWHPDRIGLFGGALRFFGAWLPGATRDRAYREGELPEVDPSEDVEFTDWTEVEAFANDVAAFVEGRLGATAPDQGP